VSLIKKQNKNHVVSFFVFYFCFYSIPRLTHKQECPRRLPGQCPLAEIPEALAVTGTPAEGRVKALQVQRERVKALQVPRERVKARSQGSIAKVKADRSQGSIAMSLKGRLTV
jgi:hypothetical protein